MDSQAFWTSVGSAGTLSAADLAKVSLHQSIIQLGVDLVVSTPNPITEGVRVAARLDASMPTIQAVVRYNVTAADGLFMSAAHLYRLRIRYSGHISAKLVQVAIDSGTETQLIPIGSIGFPGNPGFAFQELPSDEIALDFWNNAYYFEATLTAPEQRIGNPAAISVVQLYPSPEVVGVHKPR
jgi:hypothetical protein